MIIERARIAIITRLNGRFVVGGTYAIQHGFKGNTLADRISSDTRSAIRGLKRNASVGSFITGTHMGVVSEVRTVSIRAHQTKTSCALIEATVVGTRAACPISNLGI
jgi:hypothetical protein